MEGERNAGSENKASTSSRGKKMTRKQILEKKKENDEIIKGASSQKDPLSSFPQFRYYLINGLSLYLDSGRGDKLTSQLKQYIQNLLKMNMEVSYGSEWPTEEKVKRREMVAAEARYILVHEVLNPDANHKSRMVEMGSISTAVVGFVQYRFTLEEEVPVLYVYELQLEPRVQGKGLGEFLMQLLELIARKNRMGSVMLTVQKANVLAMNFYMSKLRYTISTISPSRVHPLLGLEASYEILCKTFDPEAKAILEENR